MSRTQAVIPVAPGIEVEVRPACDEEQGKSSRIYVWVKGESIFENLLNRHDRPQDVYGRVLRETVLPALGLSGVRIRWSQKAGCDCGCSPAFITMNTQILDEGHRQTKSWSWANDARELTVTLDAEAMGVDFERLVRA